MKPTHLTLHGEAANKETHHLHIRITVFCALLGVDLLCDADGHQLVLHAMTVDLVAQHQMPTPSVRTPTKKTPSSNNDIPRANRRVMDVGIKLNPASPSVQDIRHFDGHQLLLLHAW